MNVTHLKYFLETVDCGSISKAAKNLYVSQPAVSMAIKELENEFECQLLTRVNGSLCLTNAGKYLYKNSKDAVRNIDNLEKNMLNFVGKSKIIKVGIPPMLGTFILPSFLKDYFVKFPDSQIQLLEYGSKVCENAILEQNLSLGFTVIRENDTRNSEFEYYDIVDTELLFTVRATSSLAKEKNVDFTTIAKYPLILMNDGTLQSSILQEEFKERKLVPNIVIKSNQIYTIRQLLLTNRIGAFLFKQIVENDKDLVGISLKDPIKIKICLICKKNINLSKDEKSFLDFICDHANKKF